jgi:hypothetical protein
MSYKWNERNKKKEKNEDRRRIMEEYEGDGGWEK